MKCPIHTHRWCPPAGVAVHTRGIYLLHGTGEHAARYDRFALHLVAQGWRVGAHDHPGHGKSDGQRGLIDPPGSLATQAAIQIQKFAHETGCAPILFGHSLGGVVATELVLEHHLPVSGLILSAPAYAPVMRTTDRLKLKLLTTFLPSLCLDLGYDASKLTHDEDEKKTAHADSLIHGYKSANLVNWLIGSGSRSIERAKQLNIDTLLMIAGSDVIVDASQTDIFASRVPKHYLTIRLYEDFYHELLNETPERRERVMSDIDQWLKRY